MSLRLKLGLLILGIIILLSGTLWVFTQNEQQLDNIATRRRLGQTMLATSEKLALGKLVLQSDLPDKTTTINELLGDIFLMQTAVNTSLRFEIRPEDIASLRNIQIGLPAISLLLRDLQARLSLGETLTQEDILRLDQLDSIADSIETTAKEYDQHLSADAEQIKQTTTLYRNVIAVLMIVMIIAISLIIYFNILRPISILTQSAEELSRGNYKHHTLIHSKDEFGQLGNAFNDMTTQLNTFIGTLEEEVADRTRALETSAEVSRRLSTILDQEQLAKTVVDELVSSFGYYYAHIYRYIGDDKNTLVMQGGTGEAGQVMLSRGHTIPTGRGLVGRAAESNSVVLVNDTLNEEGWLPNELLPETRSEIAVPISIGDEVLGVFDVQHNVVDAFSEEDAGLLRSLANQVAIASQNAQVYVEVQNQARQEALIGDIGQKIQNTTTVEDALQVAVRELSFALSAEQSTVQLNLQAEQDEQS